MISGDLGEFFDGEAEKTVSPSFASSLQEEDADIGAGGRRCADYSAHRVNTREANTAETAEYGQLQRSPCPLERGLGCENTCSASRGVEHQVVRPDAALA